MSKLLLKKRANDSSSSKSSKETEIWTSESSLFQDNVREVLEKFDTIDTEIWGKIVYMEKNRRLAKAYARSSPQQRDSIIRVTNSSIGFDGLTIGLAGFFNPHRDLLTLEALSHLEQGIDIIMEESGNIVVNNQTESRIFIRGYNLNQPDNKRYDGLGTVRLLPHQRETLFDINLYLDHIESRVVNQVNLVDDNNNSVSADPYLERRQLELETISLICFGRETWDLLETPSYLLIINIVALDILKAKIPSKYQRKVNSNRRRSALSLISHLTGSKIDELLHKPKINLIRSCSPSKDSDSSSSELSVGPSSEASYPSLSSQFLHPNTVTILNSTNYRSSTSLCASTNNLHSDYYPSSSSTATATSTAKNINKLAGINQLRSDDRSRSWSALTTSSHHNHNHYHHHHSYNHDSSSMIKLPKPDYEKSKQHKKSSSAHKYNTNSYSSLGRNGVIKSADLSPDYSYNQTLPKMINSRSRSFMDLLSPDSSDNINTGKSSSWMESSLLSSSSKNQSSSFSSKLERLKIWRS